MDQYRDALQADKTESSRYYRTSVQTKTEQQKYLERLLEGFTPQAIADIACGGGGCSYHLAQQYPNAQFTLLDYNEDALVLAREAMRGRSAAFLAGDIHHLALESGSFDLVVCWQTLSWIDGADIAVRELMRICRPGGRILASSLFNLAHDVDVYARVHDHTRPSSTHGLGYLYNTYCLQTVREWVAGDADVLIHPFDIPIDLGHEGRGIGTYTTRTVDGRRLQFSAGMLLNWGILELRK